VVRQLTPEQIADLQRIAKHYVENAQRFQAGLKKLA
jgi:carbonic anhydrase/acetyltransferase-like protein (isoleucine patch superfamily)